MYKKFLGRLSFNEPINVLDLGANNGGFALLLMSENIQIKKLVCVELNPNTFSRMKFNIERNSNCEFVPMNAAVCGENSVLNLNLGQGGTADSIYDSGLKQDENSYRIEGRTFDDIYSAAFEDEIVDVCKIDIEGAEFDAFRSSEISKIKNCKNLIIEIHHENYRKRSELLSALEKLNFTELTEKNISDDDENHYVHFFSNRLLAAN